MISRLRVFVVATTVVISCALYVGACHREPNLGEAALNLAPVCLAGPGQVVDESTDVLLDGTAVDTGAVPLAEWSQESGTPVSLSSNAGVASFRAPNVGEPRALEFEFRAQDTFGAQCTDAVVVQVRGTNPVAGPSLSLLSERVDRVRAAFDVYVNADAGSNRGVPSGWYGITSKISLDAACIDDPLAPLGCSSSANASDSDRGTALRITFAPLAPGEFAGVNFEEPEGYASSPSGFGYDLDGAERVVFEIRTPTPGGVSVGIGVGAGKPTYLNLPQSSTFQEISLELNQLDFGSAPRDDVHNLFSVSMAADQGPGAGTVLLDNIRFEPVPASNANAIGFPNSFATVGVIPSADPAGVGPDQGLRNLATTYDSALVLIALLRRGAAADLTSARRLADTFVYALENDVSGPYGIPPSPSGARGLHDGYSSGELPLRNDQLLGDGKRGEIRLAGYSGGLPCGPTGYCLVLEGATGGANAFAQLALLDAYDALGDVAYLDAAREIATWIVENLRDRAVAGYGGYFLGYAFSQEQGEQLLVRSKSTENNADVFAAMRALAEVEESLGRGGEAGRWRDAATEAGDFVLRMFDSNSGRFRAGTLPDGPDGPAAGPGLCPAGPQIGADFLNDCDFLDSNTFAVLSLAPHDPYRNAIDWRAVMDFVMSAFCSEIELNGEMHAGLGLVPRSGPPDPQTEGIAWEFTAQAVVAMSLVGEIYGDAKYQDSMWDLLEELAWAQASDPFGDGRGLVGSTLEESETLPVRQQCLQTPFQCIPERVSLAASAWAVFADLDTNVFESPVRSLPSDLTLPQVVAVSPADSTYVSNLSLVTAELSEAVVVDDLLDGGFFLVGGGPDGLFETADDSTPITGTIEFDEDVLVASMRFRAPLTPGRYRARIDGLVQDLAGNPLVFPHQWTFGVIDRAGDTDADCLPDTLEVALGLDPFRRVTGVVPDGDLDPDADGLSNCGEVVAGSDLMVFDTDADGFSDGVEVEHGTSPTDAGSFPTGLSAEIVFEDLELGDSTVSGVAKNYGPGQARVVLYAMTDRWYVQPTVQAPFTSLDNAGSWTTTTHPWDRLAALLVDETFVPAAILDTHPSDEPGVRAWTEFPPRRTVLFSGHNWVVKTGSLVGPGPNYFSDDPGSVWVDEFGLHLSTRAEQGKWYASEVLLPASLGYGEYRFTVIGRLDTLDPQAVFAGFVYESATREIDIEFSLGLANPDNAQFVVQPYFIPGNLRTFTIGADQVTTHRFVWAANQITFESWRGEAPAPDPFTSIDSWTYVGPDVPPAGGERMRFNLWLIGGNDPAKADEVVVRDFNYAPIAGPSCPGGIVGDPMQAPEVSIVGLQPGSSIVRGTAVNLDASAQKVVVYAKTNHWFVQPTTQSPFTDVCSDGSWATSTNPWDRIVAILVDDTYTPAPRLVPHPSTTPGVLAWDEFPGGCADVRKLGDLQLPPEIEILDLTPGDPTVQGRVDNVDASQAGVVLYALTDKWYAQPFQLDPFTAICSDGSWSNTTAPWNRILALLVDGSYVPVLPTQQHPSLDSGVLAWDEFPNKCLGTGFIGDPAELPTIQITSALPSRISGIADNIDNGVIRVVLWARTNKWYVQPFTNNKFTSICLDGSWSNFTHPWNTIVALLVDPTYMPPNTQTSHPANAPGVIAWLSVP